MDILSNIENGVLTIEFNRPDKKNAMTTAMYKTMTGILKEAQENSAVRVILFQGKPNIFTAGLDLEDFKNGPPMTADSPVFEFLNELSTAKKPVIAAVTGGAIGLGTTLLLHCDLVYVGDNAKFGLPFVHLGVVPEAGSSYLLPMIAGHQRASEMLLFGETFGPQKALEAGIVTQVFPAAETLEAAKKHAEKLAALPSTSIQMTKALLKREHQKKVADQMQVESMHFRAMLLEPASIEAFSAFAEKRKPDFSKLV